MNFCLDTNIFFSFQKGINLGGSPGEVADHLTKVGKSGKVGLYMPPRIVEELYHLVEPSTKNKIDALLTQVIVQSPATHNQLVGANILYDFINENRLRTQQGLHIADDILVHAAQDYLQRQEMTKVDFQKSLQPIKENLRLRYRNATRTGFIDSVADLDLLFLAKEMDANLISADEGVVLWGRKLGVKEMGLSVFGETMRTLLQQLNLLG